MSDIRYRDRILEAIDQLRRRKARPDIQRICNFLMRRHSINSNDAKADLQKCVDREIVLKVEYKGSISYRNAAKKFSHLKRAEGSENLPAAITYSKPNRKFVALLTNAFAELIVHEPDYLEVGVPGHELIRNILSKDNVRYTKKYVSILLEKEVEIGGLIKMENSNYLLGPTKSELPLETGKHDRDLSREKEEKDGQKFFMKKERKKTVKLGMKRAKMEIGGGDERDYKPGENGMLRVGRRRKAC